MANANTPRGLIPYRMLTDGYMTGGLGLYSVAAGLNQALYVGDPLLPTGGSDAFGVPQVTIGVAGAAAITLGPMVAIAPGGPNGAVTAVTRDMPIYHPALTGQYILVAHDPNELFMIQEDSLPLAAGFIAVATAGMKNANLIAGAGSTFTGYSGWLLDSSTVAAASPTLQLRIMRALMQEDNTPGQNYCKWLVKLNLHFFNSLNGL